MILVLISDTIVLCVAVSELGQTPAITGRQSLLMLEQNHHVTMSFRTIGTGDLLHTYTLCVGRSVTGHNTFAPNTT